MIYILVTTFTLLNLFIVIIVNAMHSGEDELAMAARLDMKETLSAEIKAMEQRLLVEIARQK